VSTLDQLQALLVRDFDIPVEKLQRDARLEDLEIDSLRLIEIVFSVEEMFRITVPADQNELKGRMQTFGDLVDYIDGLVEAAGGRKT
jgi:acyl carrier protein